MKERPREAKIVQETLNQLTHQDNTTEARYIFFLLLLPKLLY